MTTAFFSSKQELHQIIDHFENHKPPSVGDRVFKGIIFVIGKKGDGTDALFPHALYTRPSSPSVDPQDDLIMPYDSNDPPPCPYPPGY